MKRTFAAAIFTLLTLTAPAHAAMVEIGGSFSGIITNGADIGDPVSGTFSYYTGSWAYPYILEGYGETYTGPIASSYTSDGTTTSTPANQTGTLGVYNYDTYGSFILQTAALNLSFSSPNFPSQHQALYEGSNFTFAATSIDWTGVVNGQNVLIHSFDIAPVPLPAAFPLFGSALAGLGGFGWLRRRGKISHTRRA